MSQTQYPQQPPVYGSSSPLLGGNRTEAGSSTSPRNAVYDQPDSDLPDDFKYGVTVSESAPEIRNEFIRKVYTILFFQILATCIVAGGISHSPNAIVWVTEHTWSLYLPMFGTLVNLGLLYWKRHSHPLNFVLLSTFTVMEAFTLGVVTAFFPEKLVLQALLITLGIFFGLTLFTLQSKYDFSGMGPWLFGGLVALLMTGLVGVFFPFGKTMDLVYAIGGSLLFSGYIVYDTFIITKKLSPDEFIMGAISLYLDFINLFISILRLLNNIQDR